MISTARSNQQQLEADSAAQCTDRQTDPKACPSCRLQIICDTEEIPGVVYPFIQNHQNSLHIQSAVLRSRMDCYFLHRCVQVSHQCCSYPKIFSINECIAVQHLLLTPVNRQELSSGFACRMTKSGWREKGVPAFTRRLLLRMFANAVKTSVCVVGASLGEQLHGLHLL